jgi:hypothetical protein
MYTSADGPRLIAEGGKMARKRNPVYLMRQETAFEVMTNEGLTTGLPGDYLAHDPISGHVWPIAASYVAQHYEPY